MELLFVDSRGRTSLSGDSRAGGDADTSGIQAATAAMWEVGITTSDGEMNKKNQTLHQITPSENIMTKAQPRRQACNAQDGERERERTFQVITSQGKKEKKKKVGAGMLDGHLHLEC